MGFNGVRKHQKIERPALPLLGRPARPAGLGGDAERVPLHADSIRGSTREWTEVDRARPSAIRASWPGCRSTSPGACPTCPTIAAQRHYVQALYHLTKTLDPTRPVIGNDGWESVATDIIGIHDYDARRRARSRGATARGELPRLFRHERPGGRLLRARGAPDAGQPIMLTEFGGIAFCDDRGAHVGLLQRARRAEEFAERYRAAARGRALPRPAGRLLLHAVRRHLSRRPTGSCTWTAARSSRSRRSRR